MTCSDTLEDSSRHKQFRSALISAGLHHLVGIEAEVSVRVVHSQHLVAVSEFKRKKTKKKTKIEEVRAGRVPSAFSGSVRVKKKFLSTHRNQSRGVSDSEQRWGGN